MSVKIGNLFDQLPPEASGEVFDILIKSNGIRLERIVSPRQPLTSAQWYDQDWHEWVILLQGSAGLIFAGNPEEVVLLPGDYVFIPAHRRHRVAWTDPDQQTVWLALHFTEDFLQPATDQ